MPETRPLVLRAAISLHLYCPLFPGRPLDQEQVMLSLAPLNLLPQQICDDLRYQYRN